MRISRSRILKSFAALAAVACLALNMTGLLHASSYSYLADYSSGNTMWVKILVIDNQAWGQAAYGEGTENTGWFDDWQCRAESWVDGGDSGVDTWSENCDNSPNGYANHEEYSQEGYCGIATARGKFWLINPDSYWSHQGDKSAQVYTEYCY